MQYSATGGGDEGDGGVNGDGSRGMVEVGVGGGDGEGMEKVVGVEGVGGSGDSEVVEGGGRA